MGGGGISDRASGETDAFSESSVDVPEAGVVFAALSAVDSASSLKIWAFMIGVEAVFRLCAFTIGDWRMLPFLVLDTLLLRGFLDESGKLGTGPLFSRSIS